MRICLVSHGFPPYERTGVENYTAGLARALARRGHTVEVFAPRKAAMLPEFSLRRDQLEERVAVTWVTCNIGPRDVREAQDRAEIGERFASFLDRERPEIVHFQHVYKLGTSLLVQAARRSIPLVYTAHDYYPVCHRYTLLRPDLAHCDVRGDSAACSRCDLALGLLNAQSGLGDYQMGVFPDQLGAGAREKLAGILAEDFGASGLPQEAFDKAFDVRFELDGQRARAFARVDRVIAPTAFLAGELVRGGFEKERIEVLPYGIETSDLVGLPPIRSGSSEPLRFAFFGGLSKHKGVHLLLEAFGRLGQRAELSIHGYSTDRPNVERLRQQAGEVGAVWDGPYEREDLPRLLAATDVVVVPSTWVENYPIVIREAFAARRPVIAFRHGALAESVRDGIDGLLVEPTGSAALADAMRRCITEDGLVASLVEGIGPVKDIDHQAQELIERYEALVGRPGSEAPSAELRSVRPFAERFREVSALPNRELFRRALAGIERLRAGLTDELPADGGSDVLLHALTREPKAQIYLRDASLENSWMQSVLQVKVDEIDWRRRSMESLTEQRDWLLTVVRGREEELAWMREKVATLARTRDDLERTINGLEQSLSEALAGRERLQSDVESLERSLEATERDLGTVEAEVDAREQEVSEVESHLRTTAELGLVALRAQERLLRTELQPMLDQLPPSDGGELLTGEFADLVRSAGLSARMARDFANEVERQRQEKEERDREIEWRRQTMQAQEAEIEWRRDQMRGAAREAARSKLLRALLRRTGLGRRLGDWDPGDGGGGAGGEAS